MTQFFLALFGLSALAMSMGTNELARRWAPIVGMCGQPFWFAYAWQSYQAGVPSTGFALSVVAFTLVYARGIYVHWWQARGIVTVASGAPAATVAAIAPVPFTPPRPMPPAPTPRASGVLEDVNALNRKHAANPEPGDYWHEMFCPYHVVLAYDGNTVTICDKIEPRGPHHFGFDISVTKTVTRAEHETIVKYTSSDDFVANVSPGRGISYVKDWVDAQAGRPQTP